MFWDKKDNKKSSGLPDLPPMKPGPLPILNPVDEDSLEEDTDDLSSLEKHNLPSFPDSPIEKGFSQTAIKDAIANEEEKTKSDDEIMMPSPPVEDKPFKTIEMENSYPSKSKSPSLTLPIDSPEPDEEAIKPRTIKLSRSEPKGDVFVKIERFYSAKKSLDAAKNKLDEIDLMLKKIRETKLREEQELSSWEKEVSSVKARIQEITENIFEKG